MKLPFSIFSWEVEMIKVLCLNVDLILVESSSYVKIKFFLLIYFLQFNMNAFHKQFLGWILFVKRSLVWVKRLFLFLQHFSNWSQ